jgi:hypothetical protein
MGKLDPSFRMLTETVVRLDEDQASKSIEQAKNLYMQRTGKSKEDADYFVRVALRNDIPVLRDKNGGKFILGAARIALDGELRDERAVNSFNKTLKLIASAHANEYDRNLNGDSAATLIQRFSGAMKAMDDKDREEVSSGQYVENKEYTVVPIDSFEEASKYGQYTSWCVTHQENMFDSYTSDGIGQFYFCLRNGFENVPEKVGEGCPLDEYGLSMVAVSVDENGALHTCTCRWNHDNGGNDSIMNTKQISKLIGRNFYEVFKPNNKWAELLDNVNQRLAAGESPEDVFDLCYDFQEGFAAVVLNNKWNFIDHEGNYLSDTWFEDCDDFQEGFARVILNHKWNFIDHEGKYLSDTWFDNCRLFKVGLAVVLLNGKYNFINREGNYLSDTWFDNFGEFYDGFAVVRLNGKDNYINGDGELLSTTWFDWCDDFNEGFAEVELNGKDYLLRKDGVLCDKNTMEPIQPNVNEAKLKETIKRMVRQLLQ